jgi:DNA/RNA endonuclease YhcR with UshA esterase domain
MDYDQFVALYKDSQVLNITGVASIFKDTYQLKPRFAEDIIKVQLDNRGKHLGLLKK